MYSRQTHTHNMTNTSKFDVLSNEYFFCLIRHLQPSNFNYATDHNWKICKSTGFFPNDYSITKFSLIWLLIGVFFYVMSNKQPHSIQPLVWSVVTLTQHVVGAQRVGLDGLHRVVHVVGGWGWGCQVINLVHWKTHKTSNFIIKDI